ncbi:SDR family NAD(P)-dependent oxidoreductase [Ornithinimicrobium sp. Y1694]|uniref:SDR family NAD(P)-dependent oxidoreductase n=1 Tax=Ornithinimicrobium sp. Y1694 TaxID=3418590 RepID=UPI003CE98F1B
MSTDAPLVSIVTGGASGIGRALVTELALRGGRVVVADRDQAGARHTSSVLSGLGYAVSPAVLDVTDSAALGELVRGVAAEEGRLDLMVNNAGIAVVGEVTDFGEEHWRRALAINQVSVIEGSLAALSVMREQPTRLIGWSRFGGRAVRGRILNTASLAGLIIAPRMLPYLTTKHAVVAFSRGLALEAKDLGVGVHVLCPDFTDTPLLDQTAESPEGAENFRASAGTIQRTLGTPADVARAALVGMDRERVLIPVGRMAQLLWRVERAAPRVFDALSVRTYR